MVVWWCGGVVGQVSGLMGCKLVCFHDGPLPPHIRISGMRRVLKLLSRVNKTTNHRYTPHIRISGMLRVLKAEICSKRKFERFHYSILLSNVTTSSSQEYRPPPPPVLLLSTFMSKDSPSFQERVFAVVVVELLLLHDSPSFQDRFFAVVVVELLLLHVRPSFQEHFFPVDPVLEQV